MLRTMLLSSSLHLGDGDKCRNWAELAVTAPYKTENEKCSPWSLYRRCFWLEDMLLWTLWWGDCPVLLLRSLLGLTLASERLLLELESLASNYNTNESIKTGSSDKTKHPPHSGNRNREGGRWLCYMGSCLEVPPSSRLLYNCLR